MRGENRFPQAAVKKELTSVSENKEENGLSRRKIGKKGFPQLEIRRFFMKKTIITAIILLFALSLAACTQTVQVFRTIRWEEGEELVYDITKDSQGSYKYEEVDGAVKIPDNVVGTMTMTVNKAYKDDSGSVSETTVEIDVWNTYRVSALNGFDLTKIDSEYVRYDESDTEAVQLRTTLRYETKFPLYSCASVKVSGKGAVIVVYKSGNEVEFNDYTAVCEKFADKKATYSLTFNNGAHENVENAVIDIGNTEFTDNTALMYIIRSLDLSALKNAGSVSLVASDIVAGAKRTVTVRTSAASDSLRPKAVENLLLESIGEEEKNKLTVVRVSGGNTLRGSYNYFYFDVSEDEAGKNVIHSSGKTVAKNRIVAMQQGYMVFMLRGFR